MYELLAPWLDQLPMSGWDLSLSERAAAMAAAAGGRWDDAERHFEAALARAAAVPHVIEVARVQNWYGEMLLERAGAGDIERAEHLLAAALETHERIGMPLYAERARVRLDKVRAFAPEPG
jgi:hypothetical protein